MLCEIHVVHYGHGRIFANNTLLQDGIVCCRGCPGSHNVHRLIMNGLGGVRHLILQRSHILYRINTAITEVSDRSLNLHHNQLVRFAVRNLNIREVCKAVSVRGTDHQKLIGYTVNRNLMTFVRRGFTPQLFGGKETDNGILNRLIRLRVFLQNLNIERNQRIVLGYRYRILGVCNGSGMRRNTYLINLGRRRLFFDHIVTARQIRKGYRSVCSRSKGCDQGVLL